MNKHVIIVSSVFLVSVIAFFLMGYFIGTSEAPRNISGPEACFPSNGAVTKESRQEIITEVEERLLKGGYIPLPPEEVYTLEDAEIKNVGSTDDLYIIVKPSVLQDPFENLLAKEIKVILTETSEIEKVVKEIDPETGEENYVSNELVLSDLKPSDKVTVESGDNIIGKSEITATKVTKKEF